MTQLVSATFREAVQEAETRGVPCVVYWDPELLGFGVYTVEEVGTIGSWVRPDMIVHKTKGSDNAVEIPQG